ncbi:MAG: protein kinase [Pirellulales bacterium]
MPQCPACRREIAGQELPHEVCPHCGADLVAITKTVISAGRPSPQPEPGDESGSAGFAHRAGGESLPIRNPLAGDWNDDAPWQAMPSLFDEREIPKLNPDSANLDARATLDSSGLPSAVDFGPASPPWPLEPPFPVPPPMSGVAPESLQTMIGPSPEAGDATHDDERPFLTIDSRAPAMSAEEIVALWSGAHSPTTGPQTTIRQPEQLAGSPRDSRLILTSRNVRQTQSPLRSSADYELIETIGEGGVGVVYAARQASIDRTVAVKMLKPASAQKPEQRDKFLSEAVVTGDLDHPNIVPIYDLGTNESGALFYSMKRVQGTPWVSVLLKKSLAENLEILLKVADAVGFAHSRGVIHRDLKPENVMLGEYGEVLVMDWGLALVTPEFRKARTIAPSASMGGTPAYMAPEMATGPVTRVTGAADVYLLGAILYEIITGQPPHTAKTVNTCLVAAARNQIQPTHHQGELLEIALRAMATRPEDRYASAREFQNAVRKYQAHSESIALSSRAELELAEARQTDNYELFSRAVFGFQEAFALWDQNARAQEGLSEAKLAYAKSASDRGDYDLAASLLDANDPQHFALIESVASAQHERALRQQRLKNAKRIVTALAAAMLVVVTGALVWVIYLYGVAEHEAQVATQQKQQADVARKKADKATELAVRAQKEEAYAGYIAKIGLAAAKVEENAFGEVDQLLGDCPSELRNWEWGRLKFLCGRSLRSFVTGGPVDAVAFDPTGERFVTGGWDGKVRVWSVDSERQPLRELDYGDRYIFSVAFAPDGTHVAVGGGDTQGGYVKIWNVDTGELVRTLSGHTERVLSVVYNADGTRLLTASYDKTARLWDSATGECLRTLSGHTWWVWSAAFSPNEDAVVTAGQDRKCIIWPLDDKQGKEDGGAQGLRIFTGHDGPVYSAIFSPDGQYVVSGGYDQRLLVWSRDQAKPFAFEGLSEGTKAAPPVFRALDGHSAAVRAIRFISEGPLRIVSASHDNTIKIWDYETGDPIQTLRGHAGWVRGCDVTPDGRLAVSASHDHQARLWSLEGYEEVRVLNARVLSGHADAITSAVFSANCQHVLTASRDRTARIWSFDTGQMLRSFAEGHDFLASQAILFRDGRRFLTSGVDNTVRIWDLATGTEIATITGTGARGLVALSSDERQIVTANDDAALLWDLEHGRITRTFAGHRGEVSALAFSPDGQYVFTGDAAGRTRLWDCATGEIVWSQRTHTGRVNGAVFTPDGSRVLTASNDNTVGQFAVATGEDLIRETLKHGTPVTAILISSDGKRVVTNAADGKIRIWDLEQRRVEHELEDLAGLVSNLSLSQDGSRLVTIAPQPTATSDKPVSEQSSVVQFWNVHTGEELIEQQMQQRMVWSAVFAPTPGEVLLVGGDSASLYQVGGNRPIMSFSPHGAVTSASYSPDQKRIVTSGGDVSAKVWELTSGHALFKLALGHEGPINSAIYSPDGQTILTASDDGTARLWNAATGDLVHTYHGPTGHTERVRSAAFAPDGLQIVTASNDKTTRVWNVSGTLVLVLDGHTWPVTCASFSADGKRILTGSEDDTARVWDARSGKLLGELAGHTAAVTSACFSPDGLRILTGSRDTTAKLWDAATMKEILTLKGHREEVASVSFSSNGRYALTGSLDGTAIVWLTEEWRRLEFKL